MRSVAFHTAIKYRSNAEEFQQKYININLNNIYKLVSKQAVLKAHQWYQPTFSVIAQYPPLPNKTPKRSLLRAKWELCKPECEERKEIFKRELEFDKRRNYFESVADDA